MNLIPIVLGVVLLGLVGYLAYSQITSMNKKISALSSSVVELQTQVKSLQKQMNNNVSFGTEQSLDALIHQIESEIDNETGQIQDIPVDMVTQPSSHLPVIAQENEQDDQDNQNDVEELNHDELYAELENDLETEIDNELGNELENELENTIEDENGDNINENNNDELNVGTDEVDVEEPSMFDSEGDEDDEDDEEEDDEEEEDEEDEEDEEEDGDDDELEEAHENLLRKVHDYYLNKTQNELKTLCKKYNKSISGNKETLVQRLLEVDKLRNVSF